MVRINLINPRPFFWLGGMSDNRYLLYSKHLLPAQSLKTPPFQNPDKNVPPDSSDDLAVNFRALPTELLLLLLRGERISERILAYLAGAESRELDPWLRDDIRIAWLCVLHCAEGISQPWEYAFWRYLGKHPDKLIPFFVERAAKHAAMESSGGVDSDTLISGARVSSGGAAYVARESAGDSNSPAVHKNEASHHAYRPQSQCNSGPLDQALYQSAREEISLPPRKPVSPVSPKEKKESA